MACEAMSYDPVNRVIAVRSTLPGSLAIEELQETGLAVKAAVKAAQDQGISSQPRISKVSAAYPILANGKPVFAAAEVDQSTLAEQCGKIAGYQVDVFLGESAF